MAWRSTLLIKAAKRIILAMNSVFKSNSSTFRIVLCALPLIWLWFVLVNDLCVEWTVNSQYCYGWAVPFLCLFLMGRKMLQPAPSRQNSTATIPQIQTDICQLLLILLAFLYTPIRLIQEANPGWRLVSWTLSVVVIGITLCLVRLTMGNSRFAFRNLSFQFSTFIFPLCFFLVAVPWPSSYEGPLIQTLTRADVAATCDLAGWLGIPAIPRANVIEVATGLVGIDEACSGIRSFQATLMVSLFLGEFYGLGFTRRLFCVVAGFILALLLNLVRLLVLVWVAAHQGIKTIAQWHDPTGVFILLACFFGLWGVVVWHAPKNQTAETDTPKPAARPLTIFNFTFSFPALGLTVWLLLVEIGVTGWYRIHEARLPAAVTWHVAWPTNMVSFKFQDIAPDSRRILRFDDGQNATWQKDGLGWQMIFLNWKPGRVAVRLAQNHTPEVCLAAVGHQLTGGAELQYLAVNGLKMPFYFYQLTDTPQPVFVAYCLWNDRAGSREFETSSLTFASRMAAVLAGQRNAGQRSLEIALTGVNDLTTAQTAMLRQLANLISIEH